MELFNYISVPVSIILGISATHLLSGLRDVIAPHRRDWLVVCWYAYLGYLHLLIWWSFFAAHAIPSWNLGTFTIAMAGPGSLYLALYTLLSEAPAAVRSWKEALPEDSPLVFHLLRSLHCDVSSPRDSLAGATVTWSC